MENIANITTKSITFEICKSLYCMPIMYSIVQQLYFNNF